jgi:hypothetical protein
MSKRSREAAQAAEEDRPIRIMLAEQDANWEAQHAANAQRTERLLSEERRQLATDRLERQAQELETYRHQAITAALSAKTLAPQVADMIPTDLATREQVDAAVQLGIDKTAEILAEVAGQREGELPVQARGPNGQFIPAPQPIPGDRGLPAGMSAEQAENMTLEDWARVRGQYMRTTDRGLFQ